MVRACCSTGADNDYKVWWDFVFSHNLITGSHIRITPQVRRNLPDVHRSLVYFFLDLSWFIASRYFIYQDCPALLGHVGFLNGLDLYDRVYRFETGFSFLLLPFILLLFNKQVRELPAVQFLLLTSIAHFAGYSILHVPPYYWYYIPEITAIVLISSFGLGVLFQPDGSKTWKRKGIQSILVILLILQASGMFYILARDGFALKEMPIHTNWATHEQYREIGEWLKEHDDGSPVLVDREIGTLGYYCDCYLSSFFSDRKWLGQFAHKQTMGNGIKPSLYKINFLFLDKEAKFPPPAYLLSEIPSGKDTSTEAIKEWRTTTKWISGCLIKLSNYSD